MKKLFLFLAIFAWTDVSAKTSYTDYEFQGYTEEKLEDDELHRYESIRLNRFYKEIETNSVYLEGLDKRGFDQVDEQDFKIQSYLRENEMPGYENEERIVVYAEKNYKIEEIRIEEAPNFFDIVTSFKIFSNDTEINYTYKIENDDIYIDLGETYNYLDLVLYLEYIIDGEYSFRFCSDRPNESPLRQKIKLDKNFDHTMIHVLKGDDFQAFIRKNNFTFYEVLHYYYYERIFYRHYDIEREYYRDSEENEIDGYIFDPEESYTLYKVFKRDKIEEPDEPTNEVDKPSSDTNPDNSKDSEKAPEPGENKKQDVIETSKPTVITCNTTNVYKYDSSSDIKDAEQKTDKDLKNDNQELNCTCNFPDNVFLKEAPPTCEKNTRAEVLKTIGEILLIIALLQFILYEFSVKHKNKNG